MSCSALLFPAGKNLAFLLSLAGEKTGSKKIPMLPCVNRRHSLFKKLCFRYKADFGAFDGTHPFRWTVCCYMEIGVWNSISCCEPVSLPLGNAANRGRSALSYRWAVCGKTLRKNRKYGTAFYYSLARSAGKLWLT